MEEFVTSELELRTVAAARPDPVIGPRAGLGAVEIGAMLAGMEIVPGIGPRKIAIELLAEAAAGVPAEGGKEELLVTDAKGAPLAAGAVRATPVPASAEDAETPFIVKLAQAIFVKFA